MVAFLGSSAVASGSGVLGLGLAGFAPLSSGLLEVGPGDLPLGGSVFEYGRIRFSLDEEG